MAALKATSAAAYRGLLKELRAAALDVAKDAGRRFADKVPLSAEGSPPSAEGFRPRTRSVGSVYVEQTHRRVTGKRPDYGALQMRDALLPAADAMQEEIAARVELVVDAAIADYGLGGGGA